MSATSDARAVESRVKAYLLTDWSDYAAENISRRFWLANVLAGAGRVAALSLAMRHETRAFLKSCGDQVLPSNVPPGWNASSMEPWR